MTRKNGFSLLEVAVATLLLGVAAAGMLNAIGSSVSATSATRDYSEASLLARSCMNELLSRRALELGTTLRGKHGPRSEWEAFVESLEGFGADASGNRLVRVRLEWRWTRGNERKSIRLEGYRRLRLP